MPILELFPKPARGNDQTSDQASRRNAPPPNSGDGKPGAAPANLAATAVDPSEIDDVAAGKRSDGGSPVTTSRPIATTRIKVRTGRYGELEEHELIHLLDSLDDDGARAPASANPSTSRSSSGWRMAWFLFYGPRVLFHVPQYRDPIALMKQHDQQLTLNLPHAPPVAKVAPKIDTKTMEALQQARGDGAVRAPGPPHAAAARAASRPAAAARGSTQYRAADRAPPLPLPTAPKPAAVGGSTLPRPSPTSRKLARAPATPCRTPCAVR